MFAPSQEAMTEADAMLETLMSEEKVPELEFGAIYTGSDSEDINKLIIN